MSSFNEFQFNAMLGDLQMKHELTLEELNEFLKTSKLAILRGTRTDHTTWSLESFGTKSVIDKTGNQDYLLNAYITKIESWENIRRVKYTGVPAIIVGALHYANSAEDSLAELIKIYRDLSVNADGYLPTGKPDKVVKLPDYLHNAIDDLGVNEFRFTREFASIDGIQQPWSLFIEGRTDTKKSVTEICNSLTKILPNRICIEESHDIFVATWKSLDNVTVCRILRNIWSKRN